MKEFNAFTVKYPARVNVLLTDALVSFPVDINKYKPNDVVKLKVNALWDTGASASVIKPSVASNLKIKPVTKTISKTRRW